MSGGRRLAPQLEACTAPNEEVAITGILSQILAAQLPPDLVAEEFEVAIVQGGFRSVTALRHMKEHHLSQLGLDVGTAAMVYGTLGAPQPAPQAQPPAVVVNANPTVKLGALRKFPEVNASTGMPEMGGWEVAAMALQALLRPVISQEAKLQVAALDVNAAADMSAWVNGCADDEVIWSAMINSGTGSLPEALVLKLPGDLKTAFA